MQDTKTRECEKTPEEASALADFDYPRDPKEFLREIYKEAYNAKQDPDARISKTVGKCSALFAHLSADQERIHRSIRCWTIGIGVLTAAIIVLTGVLIYYTAKLVEHEKKPAENTNQTNQNTLKAVVNTN